MKDKILRYFLLGFAILSVGFASFSSADLQVVDTYNLTLRQNTNYKYYNTQGDFVCVVVNSASDYSTQVAEFTVASTPGWNMMIKFNGNTSNTPNMDKGMGYCGTQLIDIVCDVGSCNLTFKTYKVVEYTSLQCQTNYSLIPVSSVDQNYCTSNNLCSVCEECQECYGTGGVSNLFINDIFHPGAFNVVINIPEEIDWDYAYTSNGTNFNLDVVGYNQDTEYIEGLIDVQNYKPTSEDFSKVFLNFGNFGTLLIACLFVILVFYFVKKMFK